MGALIQAVDGHQMAVEQDATEEQQRIAREMMIKEQDMAYQESLAQDKQKVHRLFVVSAPPTYFLQAQRAEEEQLAKERAAQAKLQQAMKEEVW